MQQATAWRGQANLKGKMPKVLGRRARLKAFLTSSSIDAQGCPLVCWLCGEPAAGHFRSIMMPPPTVSAMLSVTRVPCRKPDVSPVIQAPPPAPMRFWMLGMAESKKFALPTAAFCWIVELITSRACAQWVQVCLGRYFFTRHLNNCNRRPTCTCSTAKPPPTLAWLLEMEDWSTTTVPQLSAMMAPPCKGRAGFK